MVFDPEAAPTEHRAFMAWYGTQTEWREGAYEDPDTTSEKLRAWLFDMIPVFPPLNKVLSDEELPRDDTAAADYSMGAHFIYACFAWSKTDLAYRNVFDLAAKHRLGFFDVSGADQEVWLPAASGTLSLAHTKSASSLLGKVQAFFRKA